jgi:ankyrin repeat protein
MLVVSALTSVLGLLLAATGACPEPQVPKGPWIGTALHQAIRKNDVNAARRAMNAATVNERDSLGNTPLIAALTPSASLEPAGVIDPRQAKLRIQAESTARQAIVAALLAAGASVTEPGDAGVRPLMQLSAWGYSPAVDLRLMQQFLRHGADVNARDDSGTTALMLAARRGKKDLVKLLLSKRADPKIKNCHGEDAASLARFGGFVGLAEELSAHE